MTGLEHDTTMLEYDRNGQYWNTMRHCWNMAVPWKTTGLEHDTTMLEYDRNGTRHDTDGI